MAVIITHVAASEGTNPSEHDRILENDTETKKKKTRRTVRFRRVKRLEKRESEAFGEAEGECGSRIRIEHQSLILAQDERWRRA